MFVTCLGIIYKVSLNINLNADRGLILRIRSKRVHNFFSKNPRTQGAI